MYNVYKIFKLFSHTTTLKFRSYRFELKTNSPLLGATESHALPIKLNDKKVSMYNNTSKEIEPLTKQKFEELMKIIS